METNRLSQFCTVYETGSLRQAADMLSMSHGALSKSLKILEEQLGQQLFVPAGRGLTPSDQGRRLYPHAKRLLSEVAEFEQRARAPEELRSVLRIGTFEVFSTYFMAELAAELAADTMDLLVRELTPGKMEAALTANEVDYAITYIPIPQPDLHYDEIGQVRMGLYGQAKVFGEQTLADMPFCAPAIPIEGAPNRVTGLDGWPDHKVPRHIRYQVDMMETAMALARSGLGVVWLPRFVAQLHNASAAKHAQLERLTPVGLPSKTAHPVYLVRRLASDETRAHKRLAKLLRQQLKRS